MAWRYMKSPRKRVLGNAMSHVQIPNLLFVRFRDPTNGGFACHDISAPFAIRLRGRRCSCFPLALLTPRLAVTPLDLG